MQRNPKELVQEIVEMVGKRAAERLLVGQKVSTSTAGKLVRGTYASEVGEWLAERISAARAGASRAS